MCKLQVFVSVFVVFTTMVVCVAAAGCLHINTNVITTNSLKKNKNKNDIPVQSSLPLYFQTVCVAGNLIPFKNPLPLSCCATLLLCFYG